MWVVSEDRLTVCKTDALYTKLRFVGNGLRRVNIIAEINSDDGFVVGTDYTEEEARQLLDLFCCALEMKSPIFRMPYDD